MRSIYITIALICVFTSASAKLDLKYSDLFDAWKLQNGRSYGNFLEEASKYETFFDNYIKILSFNAENNGVTLALNEFADMTGDEFGQYFKGLNLDPLLGAAKADESYEDDNDDEVNLGANLEATSIDWVAKGAVTKVKNQECGDCWAFATIAALEGYGFIKNKKLVDLSEQQVLDCTTTCSGCNGCANTWNGLAYTAKAGAQTQASYPMKSGQGRCAYNKAKVAVQNAGYKKVTANSASALKTALNKQPVAVAIQADQNVFQFYSSGVIKSGCGASLNHAVTAVGYTTISGVEAFKVKNSWGANWGQNGYVYISTSGSANGGAGVCGILSMCAYPTGL